MEYRFTRQELYDRVWSKPMTRLVSELGTTIGPRTTLLRHAGIPTPPSGYWIKKEFGKPIVQVPLPPAPNGCCEPLVLDTHKTVRRRGSKPYTVKTEAVAAEPPEPAQELAKPSSTLGPELRPRPTEPTTLTRDELYDAVWTAPIGRLAEQYGISGNGLAKICDRANILSPSRGYWAKHAVGKAPAQSPLPTSDSSHSITIRPTSPPPPPIELPQEVRQQVDKARASESTIAVQERLLRPHAIIASWLAEHEEKKRRARKERDPWARNLYDPGPFSETEHRKHRILDALFKAIERQGGKIKQGERLELIAEVAGQNVEFQVREKKKQERRPLTADERRWRSSGDNGWKQELVPTGRLVFEIREWHWPAGLQRQWVETEKQAMEVLLPDILTTFVAAGPLLVQQRKCREAAERERQLEEQRRYEEKQRRKRDANRWRRFREMAQDWHELAAVRDFTAALRSMNLDASMEVDGRTIGEWIAWAENWLQLGDPTADGAGGVFEQVASITDWHYRD